MRHSQRRPQGRGKHDNYTVRDERRKEGEARNAKWQSLSPAAQLAALDDAFGPNQGATKQRKQLAAKLNLT